jgi:polysaccharide deacetylase family protein (PEP-CTERM system associated)
MNILTFDIEEWFHLLDTEWNSSMVGWDKFEVRIHSNVEFLIEMCVKHQQKATFFCLGWIADKYPEVIKKIDRAGFEIGSHTHSHQLAHTQTAGRFRQDVNRSIGVIENLTGKKVKSFRAPGFSVVNGMPWFYSSLLELGIEHDSSMFLGQHGHGGFRDLETAGPLKIKIDGCEMKEYPIVPVSVFSIPFFFSGGGYFRLMPYWFIEKLTKKNEYLMAYFHPRDFDVGQPVLDLPLSRRFKSYVGIKGARAKLDRWFTMFRFCDICNADQKINWTKVPVLTCV